MPAITGSAVVRNLKIELRTKFEIKETVIIHDNIGNIIHDSDLAQKLDAVLSGRVGDAKTIAQALVKNDDLFKKNNQQQNQDNVLVLESLDALKTAVGRVVFSLEEEKKPIRNLTIRKTPRRDLTGFNIQEVKGDTALEEKDNFMPTYHYKNILETLKSLSGMLGGKVKTLYETALALEEEFPNKPETITAWIGKEIENIYQGEDIVIPDMVKKELNKKLEGLKLSLEPEINPERTENQQTLRRRQAQTTVAQHPQQQQEVGSQQQEQQQKQDQESTKQKGWKDTLRRLTSKKAAVVNSSNIVLLTAGAVPPVNANANIHQTQIGQESGSEAKGI